MRKRLNLLEELRSKASSRYRADAEARYQSTINRGHRRSVGARREAVIMLEQGRAADLPELAANTMSTLEGTPVEDLAQQFIALSDEAESASEEPWIVRRNALLARLESVEGDAESGVSAAAAIMLDGGVAQAKAFLLGSEALNTGISACAKSACCASTPSF